MQHTVAVEIFLSLLFLSWELDLFELIHRSALSWFFWCVWLLTASRFEALFEELQVRSIGGGENKSCAG
ncbi:hypothetical protein MUK42_35069 [Musa troglodytarum]|uniref:Uncharacterized protein n=1 Tax=Musa troglodytarum TaxID=320322 RepID=A0A9E7JB79_9LILI|nr:hypothetical protein MUK42_35069 [Musa troglodytarum]